MKHLNIALFLGLLGIIAGAFVVPYQMELMRTTLGEAEYKKIISEIPVSIPIMITMMSLQLGIMTTVLGWIGLKLTERTGLSLPLLQAWLIEKTKPAVDRSAVKLAVIGGAIGAIFLVIMDLLLFQPYLPKIGTGESVVWWKAVLGGVFYGGIIEEVFIRLFLMTLIIWLLSFIFKKRKDSVPTSFYWIGITLAALLFGAGHLPATEAIYGDLNSLIITRALVLNGVLGILFGFLYWKKGLEYAIVAHMMVHIITQMVLLPLLKLI
ncbi:CPBP family intramembrane metalloprotease [Fictibacillus sp. UD]|uniref:CPBP family glutamic-type intramembrane protease n=1 Tax=Fictibacillus sp. UD TaxID=3038777 RepID=UPI0037453BB6